MPFLADKHFPIPTKDILSWSFDEPLYDLDKVIYIDAVDQSRLWNGRQAKRAIRQIAAGFNASGLSKGDCVCIHSFNDVNYPILVNGILGFGGVYAGTNPAYQPYELIHHLKTSKAKFIIVEPELLEHLLVAAKEVGISKKNILLFDNHNEPLSNGLKSWRILFEHGEMDWPKFDDAETAENTTVARLYSSGTTGLPKAGMLSHRNLIAQHTLVNEWKPTPWDKRRLIALPMFHAATAPVCHYSPLRSGDTCYILKRFELESYLYNIERHQITEGAFVPPIVIGIINSPYSKKYSLKSMRYANAGAAPLGKGAQARLKALMHEDAPLTQVWGMTETSCICSMSHYSDGHETSGSVGKMLPNVDSKLVDDAGKDITDYDVRGELCVRGPNVIKGYFENPEANKRDWDEDGYFHTGDIAYRSKGNDLWYIVDRKKELIKVRSFQVAPPELEAVLLSHPEIVDAAVIGVRPNDEDTELPRAYIVKRPESGNGICAEEVKKYMAERLANYKRLDGGVMFVESIPKNASGKILKRLLREQAQKEIERESGSRL